MCVEECSGIQQVCLYVYVHWDTGVNNTLLCFAGSRTIACIDPQSAAIRHGACELLLPCDSRSTRCKQCSSFRASLRVRSIRQKKRTEQQTDPSSSVPYSVLSKEELQTRLTNLHSEFHRIQKQQDRLKQRLEAVVKMQGVAVDEQTHDDLKQIIRMEGSKLMEKTAPNSFQRVFWQQQMDAASREDARGMRWHPLMIRWCIYLRHQSQGAYETLPSQRTLRNYTHHIKPTIGFSAGVVSQLYQAAKLDLCEEREKYVILLLDGESRLRQALRRADRFHESRRDNSHLLALQRSLTESESSDPPLANTVMTFMVRGRQFAYAYFPCHNITGDLLYDPLWEAVYRLERCGFKVSSRSRNIIIQYVVSLPVRLYDKLYMHNIHTGNGCNI